MLNEISNYYEAEDFLYVGSLFESGGEVYSKATLMALIEAQLGYSDNFAIGLLNLCVAEGFLIELGDGDYTR